ncbi:ATPase associated with various cellular activities, AAA_5 [Rhodopseudomonas palustris BisB5]|uniref:ATPase associated with various cellular activities, AAA_5 n=1 Tax=Rhodopseudomonas palustris (strain BisB5) TaxID=316057 RepID=Q139N1_RHOPS|nr:ATPase associated with various cellular activities, AAA_5 [Rhodopseudomonas palustris BisB5]
MGSDNNKGVETDWTQGIRALARCSKKTELAKKKFEIELDDVFILPRSIEKSELLTFSPATYARDLQEAAIVGLNNYASQVVQLLSDKEFATLGAVIAELLPDVQEDILKRIPGADSVELLVAVAKPAISHNPAPLLVSQIDDEDPILAQVRQLVEIDGWGGVLLTGAPGTGKSFYAREIAIKLTGGDRRRIREVQFHPSYQYEDFVEGYVPDGKQGFRLADKHMLEMAEIAKSETAPVVLVIDEFSRTDPARVLGEVMTYMEGSLRDKDFYLPSGRRVRIPRNLIFIATMNPEDRSVDEIDAAMERRWAKVGLKPDVRKLRDFLVNNRADELMMGPTVDLFLGLQKHMEIGHAFFRTVKDPAGLSRLWNNQLSYVFRKRFRFDTETLGAVDAIWGTCEAALIAATPAADLAAPQVGTVPGAGAAAPVESSAPSPAQEPIASTEQTPGAGA